MFVIQSEKSKTITWPVTVETAVDGGKIKKFEFTGTFLLLGDDEKEAIVEELKTDQLGSADTDEGANAWKEAAIDGILRVMTDWKGVVDENKTPIAFNRDNLRAAARSAQGVSIIRAINTAVSEISMGARTKN